MILTLSTLAIAVSSGVVARRLLGRSTNRRHARKNKAITINASTNLPIQSNDAYQEIEQQSKRRLKENKVKQHEFKMALASAPVAWLGLSYWPLSALSVMMMSYVRSPEFSRGLQAFRERRISQDHVNTFALGACLISGHIAVAATVAAMLPLREYLVEMAEDKAEKKLGDAFLDLPQYAWISCGGVEKRVPLNEVQVGDVVIITAGSVIPVDGVVVSGEGSIDNHQFTGEWKLAEVEAGTNVLAGGLLNAGRIQVQALKIGLNTCAAEISEVLHAAGDKKLNVLSRSEEFANQRAPLLLAIGIVGMPFLGLYQASALAIGGPGGAFRFSAPIVVLQTLSHAADEGILIKDGRSLELLKNVDIVVFDKTGTLTENQLEITEVYCVEGVSKKTLLLLAAAAEQGAEHPIAEAILSEAEQYETILPSLEKVAADFGLGITAVVGNDEVMIGSRRFFELQTIESDWQLENMEIEAAERGHSLIFVGQSRKLIGAIELSPTIRESSAEVIESLKEMGIKPMIISGDNAASTKAIAKKVGVSDYFAEAMPKDKSTIIESLQEQGHKVCFVGDGINDSPALKCADVSISLKGSTTLAMDTAQIVLARTDLRLIIKAFSIAQGFDQSLEKGKMLSNVIPLFGIGSLFLLNTGYLVMSLTNLTALIASLYVASKGRRLKNIPYSPPLRIKHDR